MTVKVLDSTHTDSFRCGSNRIRLDQKEHDVLRTTFFKISKNLDYHTKIIKF